MRALNHMPPDHPSTQSVTRCSAELPIRPTGGSCARRMPVNVTNLLRSAIYSGIARPNYYISEFCGGTPILPGGEPPPDDGLSGYENRVGT